MELQQLRAFVTVARTGQLVRAADVLHLTQSAVSKQIKGLEATLGLALFGRTPAGMVLTAEGQRLLPLAQHTLDAAQALGRAAASLRGTVCGPLRLGTIVDPDSIRLGALLAALQHAHPQVVVTLRHGISGSVLQQLRDGQLDACFHLGVVDDPELCAHPLLLEHYVVVGPPAWATQLQQAGWAELAALPWLATPPGSSQHRLVQQMFAAQGLAFRTVVEADQEATMLQLVHTGVALGLMRERVAATAVQAGQVVTWPGARLPCPLALLLRRAQADSPVLQALLTTLRQVWPDAPAR